MAQPAPTHPPVFLRLFGGPRLCIDGQPITPVGRNANALLGYLALIPGHSERRAKLAGLVWDELPDIKARQNLRQTLYELRSVSTDVAPNFVGSDRDRIWLNTDVAVIETDELFAALDRSEVPEVLLQPPGIAERLLADIDLRQPGFDAWIRLSRRTFEEKLAELLFQLQETGAPETAVRAAQALALLDPTDERAQRFLILRAARSGDVPSATRIYADLWDRLDQEFGVEPAEPTQALMVAIKQGEIEEGAGRVTETSRSPARQRPTIQVEKNMAIDKDPLLTSILLEDLMSCLGRFRGLHVIDADASHARPDFRLRFSAWRFDELVEFRARLTAMQGGEVLWSYRIEHPAHKWLEIRASLASSLAASCDISLSRRRLAEIRSQRSAHNVFDQWLIGQYHLDEFRPEAWYAAEDAFRRAATSAPDFSPAHSSLAQIRNTRHLAFPGHKPDTAGLHEGLQSANLAVSADPYDARAHLARAWSCALLRHWNDSDASFSLALAANPDDPWTVISTALGMAFLGEHETAGELADRSLAEGWTTSRSEWGYHVNIRFLAGDFAGCLAAYENAQDGILNLPAWAAAAEMALGRSDQAVERWHQFEVAVRPHWTADEPASTPAILQWFQSLFPIRHPENRMALIENSKRAADAYLHWLQE